MTLSRFRTAVIFCPTAITGGPEAIHQLSQSLHAIGVRCYLVHVGTRQRAELKAGGRVLEILTPAEPRLMDAYGAYGPVVVPRLEFDAETLVIFPEGLLRHHRGPQGCGVAVWWLSVDNAYRGLAGMDAEAEIGGVLGRPDVYHLYQSAYARDWLRGGRVERLYDLADYTSPLFTAVPPGGPAVRPAISYNAAKGSELASSFFAANPHFDALALRGFSKPELRDIFRERLIYVDFGHFPGKDRMPREAAASGGVVFVHRKGAGASFEDFPLPDFYKFNEADVASGALRERLNAVIADPRIHWDRQSQFRDVVLWEKAAFHDQVMRHWGVRRVV